MQIPEIVHRLQELHGTLGDLISEIQRPETVPPPPEPEPEPEPETPPAPGLMCVRHRQLFDAGGKPVLVRGLEGWYGPNAQANVDRFFSAIASTGCNAVRLQMPGKLPLVDGKLSPMGIPDVDRLIRQCYAHNLICYVNVDNMPNGGQSWFGRTDVREYLQRPDVRRNIIIDATIELEGDAKDKVVVDRWFTEQKEVVTRFRDWGYKSPLLLGTPNAGRYLRGLLDHGQALVDHDPEHSLILNCQMYWAQGYSSGWCYEYLNGYPKGDDGVRQAFEDIARAPFLIQLGLDGFDSGGDWKPVPYRLQMQLCDQHKVGSLFWEWKDPSHSNPNDLTRDAFDPNALTDLGKAVLPWLRAAIKAAGF